MSAAEKLAYAQAVVTFLVFVIVTVLTAACAFMKRSKLSCLGFSPGGGDAGPAVKDDLESQMSTIVTTTVNIGTALKELHDKVDKLTPENTPHSSINAAVHEDGQ